jgi:hypothetical protein
VHVDRVMSKEEAKLRESCVRAPLPVAPGVPEAAQAHGGFLLPCLRVLAEQRRRCARHVQAFLTTLAEEPGEAGGPSDVTIVQSLPGVGRKITAWLFAEAAQPLAQRKHPCGLPAPPSGGRYSHEASAASPACFCCLP